MKPRGNVVADSDLESPSYCQSCQMIPTALRSLWVFISKRGLAVWAHIGCYQHVQFVTREERGRTSPESTSILLLLSLTRPFNLSPSLPPSLCSAAPVAKPGLAASPSAPNSSPVLQRTVWGSWFPAFGVSLESNRAECDSI